MSIELINKEPLTWQQSLEAPIAKMQKYKPTIPTLSAEDSPFRKVFVLLALTPIKEFHADVINKGELVSRKLGIYTYKTTKFLMTPMFLLSRFLKKEDLGAKIQEAVALSTGFVMRGLTLGLSQLLHTLPYALSFGLTTSITVIPVGAGIVIQIVGLWLGIKQALAVLAFTLVYTQIKHWMENFAPFKASAP